MPLKRGRPPAVMRAKHKYALTSNLLALTIKGKLALTTVILQHNPRAPPEGKDVSPK
jgi:hypothetical protein